MENGRPEVRHDPNAYRRAEATGHNHRCRWRDAEKLKTGSESFALGANIFGAARRNGVHRGVSRQKLHHLLGPADPAVIYARIHALRPAAHAASKIQSKIDDE